MKDVVHPRTEAEASGEKQVMTILLGSVSLPRMTGRILTDSDGWHYYEMTDRYDLDRRGVEVPGSRRPAGDPVIKWRFDDPAARPWWRFWG